MKKLPILIALLLLFPAASFAGIIKGPYLQNPTASAVTVCWVTDRETTGTVTWTPESGGPSRTLATSKRTRYHRARLTGLKPYARYRYQVACDGQTEAGTFRTAAPPRQPFKFIAYGDTRTQSDKHAAVLARMAKFQPDFILQTGDLVANGNNENQWTVYFQTAREVLRHAPYFPALGNHEDNGAPYFRYFDVKNEYSFNYGNAHFVALDTNREPAEFAAQEAWLRKDLAANQRATWRVVFFHHTMHTCVTIKSRREEAKRLRARLEPIFQQYRVQLVINGHDHNYQRHLSEGITYLVTGGGGAPLYDVRPDTPFVKFAKKTHHHCEISVNGPIMKISVVEPDGNLIDSFDIRATP